MLMDMCSTMFHSHRVTVAPNYFKSHINFLCPYIFSKNKFCLMPSLELTLSDIASFLPGNLSGPRKKLYSGLKMMLKMKNGSHRYDIKRHGHKYTKYKMYLNIMIFMYIKQHLSKI